MAAPCSHPEVLIEHLYVPGSVLGTGDRGASKGGGEGWGVTESGRQSHQDLHTVWTGWERDILARAPGRWTLPFPKEKLGVGTWAREPVGHSREAAGSSQGRTKPGQVGSIHLGTAGGEEPWAGGSHLEVTWRTSSLEERRAHSLSQGEWQR